MRKIDNKEVREKQLQRLAQIRSQRNETAVQEVLARISKAAAAYQSDTSAYNN